MSSATALQLLEASRPRLAKCVGEVAEALVRLDSSALAVEIAEIEAGIRSCVLKAADAKDRRGLTGAGDLVFEAERDGDLFWVMVCLNGTPVSQLKVAK